MGQRVSKVISSVGDAWTTKAEDHLVTSMTAIVEPTISGTAIAIALGLFLVLAAPRRIGDNIRLYMGGISMISSGFLTY